MLSEAIARAGQLFLSQRFAEVRTICQQILQSAPEQPDALHLLGLVALSQGQVGESIALISRAVAQNGSIPEYHNHLGLAWLGAGHFDRAAESHRRAISLRPQFPEAEFNLGNALRAAGDFSGAADAFQRALALRPGSAEALNNLGDVLMQQGSLEAAADAFRRAISLRPGFAGAINNLGNVLLLQQRVPEAIAQFRSALAVDPRDAPAAMNLAAGLLRAGDAGTALGFAEQARSLQPQRAEAHHILGLILCKIGRVDEAIASQRQAIQLRSGYADAHLALGDALRLIDLNHLDEAAAEYQKALESDRRNKRALHNLAMLRSEQGQVGQAVELLRKADQLDPADPVVASNLIYLMYFHSGTAPPAIQIEESKWNDRFAMPLMPASPPQLDRSRPNRKLRVGYVSPDFRKHSQSFFTLPLLKHHNRDLFDVICYSDVSHPDEVTGQVRLLATEWREISALSDAELAELVRADRIDILVDLTLHMDRNRLLAFARKPAPVQVTWLGYPGSTGLRAMDYRLSDPYLDPPDANRDGWYSERTIRLADSFWCYAPLEEGPALTEPPAVANGFVTFGCLNNFNKINSDVLALWVRVMSQVPGSRLLLLSKPGSHRAQTIEWMAQRGISPARIQFESPRSHDAFLELFQRVDLSLDPFPADGHTTSMDSLWMGVPVITLPGESAISRGALSILSNIGRREWIAADADGYVRIAAELAADLQALAAVRASLRDRMRISPLMDAKRFAAAMEAALLSICS